MPTDLTPELLLRAYASGIFPMGDKSGDVRWYAPDPRCVFDLDKFDPPKRLLRTYRQGVFQIGINTAWKEVLQHCSREGTDEGVWITDKIVEAYTNLNYLGFAHSIEAYKDGELAGGLYGVCLRGAFFGESMFHIERDASKICLVFLIERLKARGYSLLDSQYMTPHLRSLGATSIRREEYLRRLQRAMLLDCSFV
ncbi:MAG TPA: leucyl/phenylalanyl-tRNA--protein transferase [Planktothrix sp.]|jgi:leucyl/phenylalanyl-tRNA--protein transferase